MESFSPRLMLSSEVAGGKSGSDTPMSSADSRRVETEERRLWWEFRFVEGRMGFALLLEARAGAWVALGVVGGDDPVDSDASDERALSLELEGGNEKWDMSCTLLVVGFAAAGKEKPERERELEDDIDLLRECERE